ncbi:hypothetical protein VIGAN_02157000, partial [Vigna angularis var. angularis]
RRQICCLQQQKLLRLRDESTRCTPLVQELLRQPACPKTTSANTTKRRQTTLRTLSISPWSFRLAPIDHASHFTQCQSDGPIAL